MHIHSTWPLGGVYFFFQIQIWCELFEFGHNLKGFTSFYIWKQSKRYGHACGMPNVYNFYTLSTKKQHEF